MKLERDFYLRPTLAVAKSLIGKFLVHQTFSKVYAAEIIETEAYCGFDDRASHASRGKTPRNAVMFGPAGFSYVYLIYGIYHCLNLVTEKEGFPAAVLIRGLDYSGADLSRLGGRDEADGLASAKHRLDGPGKLCREFKIKRETHNGLDLAGDILWVEDRGLKREISSGKRIGVDYAGACKNRPWRFLRKP